MTRPSRPNTVISILLYMAGMALIAAAILVVLKGLGVLSAVPGYVFGGLALFVIGAGILGRLRNSA
ncbi:MAG: hypothetical protein AAGF01_24540 [Cyanobacteria bacterium P01_G01_bin.38]